MSVRRIPITGMDRRPFLRGLNRRLVDALTLFLPGHFSPAPAEHFVASMQDTTALDVVFLAGINGTSPETVMFFTAGSGLEGASLSDALNAVATSTADMFQAWSDSPILATIVGPDREEWKTRARSFENGLFSRFTITSPSEEISLIRIIPDAFFATLSELIFGEKITADQSGDPLKLFFEFVTALEDAAQVEFPDGMAGLDFDERWVFTGGQCASLKRSLYFTDMFALSPGDTNLLLNELRHRGLYRDFETACVGCIDIAVSAMKRVFSSIGSQEFSERLSSLTPTLAQRTAAIDSVLNCVEGMFENEKISPPPSVAARLRASIDARNDSSLFDAVRAREDFVDLLLRLPPHDLQYALTQLPKIHLARAIELTSNSGMMRLLAAVRSNTSKSMFNTLTEEMRRAARTAAEKNDRSYSTRAKLACINVIHDMSKSGALSDAVHSNDPDWLDSRTIQEILKKSTDKK